MQNAEILLVLLPPWGLDIPPLGVACLSTYLRERGFFVEIFDFNIELFHLTERRHAYLWNMNYADWWHDASRYAFIKKELGQAISHLTKRVADFPQKFVGFSLPTNCSDLLLRDITREIKKNNEKTIIVGGVSVSIEEQRAALLNETGSYIDYCITGEGEESLGRLLETLCCKKRSETSLKTTVVLNGNSTGGKDPKIDGGINFFPFPVFEGFDLRKYALRQSLPVEFSRGCVGNCPFCDFRSVSPHFKVKSPQYIQQQIQFYHEKYSVNHLTFVDAAINGDMKALDNACNLLIAAGNPVALSALALPRREMDYAFLRKMKKAGFYRLEYGVESGSDKVLTAMKKPFTSQIAARVLRDTERAGIEAYIYCMVGYVGESDDDFEQTKKFLKANARSITKIRSINPLYVMAGSQLSRNAHQYNITFPLCHRDREWYIGNVNTYDIRKKRVMALKNYARALRVPFSEDAEMLEFTLKHLEAMPSATIKKRGALRWLILGVVFFYTFFYIVYFWLHMIFRNHLLLGGKR